MTEDDLIYLEEERERLRTFAKSYDPDILMDIQYKGKANFQRYQPDKKK